MSIWGAIAGGMIGTVVLSTALRAGQELGWTRMDIPFLLGAAFTGNRSRALAIGYGVHFANGVLFSLGYAFVFWATGASGILFGALLDLVHALFVGVALANLLLPSLHPRMGTPWSDAEETPFLEPPGFMLVNYGTHTVFVTIVAHVVYGAIVGWFAAGV